MEKIEFEFLNEKLANVLIQNGIKEEDLFKHQTDLYVGCKFARQASLILNGGKWRAISETFIPQKGSDMEHYPIAVDIGFALLDYELNKLKNE